MSTIGSIDIDSVAASILNVVPTPDAFGRLLSLELYRLSVATLTVRAF